MTGSALIELPQWTALAPALLLVATAMVLFVLDSIVPEVGEYNRTALTATGLIGSLASMVVAAWFLLAGTGQTGGAIELFADTVVVDGMALFFMVITASVTALVVLASHDYIAGEDYQAEFFSLLFLAASGMSLLGATNSLASAFVALELASLPSYALVAFLKHNRGSVEGGLKYFLIGALSSSVFLYGVSLVYGATGALQFDQIAQAIDSGTGLDGVLGLGIVMVVGGVAFKTAAVPFHFWAPEAYEGAPAPVSAFLSSASKAAGFVLAFRVFVVAFPQGALAASVVDWSLLFLILSIVTMTLGNFAAATQEEVKRMLAYSSIGHAGYVLIALAAIGGGNDGIALGAGMAHLLVYGFMNTGAFLFIALAEYWGIGREFEDYNGLAREAPVACVAMTVFMFSLAGLPVGAGFLSKYFLFAGAVGAGLWWLAVIATANSALSLYYYSRVVKAMWIEEPDGELEIESYPVGLYAAVVGAAVVTVVLLPLFGPVGDEAIAAAEAIL
jgi:NADH-quinone oxidoreductase subunit N